METPNDRPPLTTITTSGIYRLRLTAPKLDKIRTFDDGTCSARLFFVDEAGNCLWINYGTKFAGSLAMLVGRLSGNYAKEIAPNATPADLQVYLKPAVGKATDISVEVTPKIGNDGKTYYNYKLIFPRGSQKPSAPAADLPSEPPF